MSGDANEDKIKLNDEWLLPAWDGAHNRELVIGDIKKDERESWYQEVIDNIGEIQPKLSHGQNH